MRDGISHFGCRCRSATKWYCSISCLAASVKDKGVLILIVTSRWHTRMLGKRIRDALPRRHSTVDEQIGAGRVRAFIRGEEKRSIRDFLGSTSPSQHDLAEHRLGPSRVV